VRAEHRLLQPGDVVGLGDVEDVGAHRAAGRLDLGALGLSPLGIDLGDLDQRTVLGEQPGDRAADPVTAAGDHGDLAVQHPVPVGDRRHVLRPLLVRVRLLGHVVSRCRHRAGRIEGRT
jgi:hypothetical protein